MSENKPQHWRESFDRFWYYVSRPFRPTQPTAYPQMGAVPHADGVSFRVWAPHADKVFVAGSFNHWSPWRTPLALEPEGHGVWSATVRQAQVGDEYKYVIHRQGESFLRADPYARDVTAVWHNSVITPTKPEPTTSTPFTLPPREELIIYELHIGTFGDKGTNVVGTFHSTIAKLPYLQELGINAIEIMPIKEFNGDYSWGYNPAFPFAITRTYGGRAAFLALIQAAHAHGMGVIVDVVYNHFGPQDLHLWRFDGWYENDLGGIYFYNDWRSKTPWADTRPDYGRREVRQYIHDNVTMWLEEFNVDGLRWDATNYIRNAHGHDGDPGGNIAEGWQVMQEINTAVATHHPHKLIIAEDLQSNPWLTQSPVHGGAGFHAQWDAQFVHPIRHAIITPNDDERSMMAVAAAIHFSYNDHPFQRVIYTESHDEVANGKARVPEEISPGRADDIYARKRSTLGAAMVFTSPGIPMLFQGQEFLENGWFTDQVPLDWQKANSYSGILRLYRDLIRLRRNLQGQSRGLLGAHVNVFHVNEIAKVIAFHRWQEGGAGDDVIIVANFAHTPHPAYAIGLPQSGLWRVRFNSDEQKYSPDFGNYHCPDIIAAAAEGRGLDGLPFLGNVRLAPYACLMLSQDKE
jgi:1,4-alpha-glucan branching enzyme